MKRDERVPSGFLVIFLLIGSFTLMDFAILAQEGNIAFKLGGHALLSCGLFLLTMSLMQKSFDMRFVLVFALFIMTLGPLGGLTIFVSLLLYLIYVKITDPLADLLRSLMPDMRQDKSDVVYDRILYHLDDFHSGQIPIPFKDIMVFGSYKQKRMAIEKMLRYYRPEFAADLRLGLLDKSNAVKVQAATAISFIDHKLFDANIRLKALVEENPDDIDLLRRYAKDSELYALAEILDPDRKDKVLKSAIASYEKYLSVKKEDHEALFSLARLYSENHNDLGAKNALEMLLKNHFTPKYALLYMQTLYQLGELDALSEYAHLMEDKLPEHRAHDEFYESVRLWGGAA